MEVFENPLLNQNFNEMKNCESECKHCWPMTAKLPNVWCFEDCEDIFFVKTLFSGWVPKYRARRWISRIIFNLQILVDRNEIVVELIHAVYCLHVLETQVGVERIAKLQFNSEYLQFFMFFHVKNTNSKNIVKLCQAKRKP